MKVPGIDPAGVPFIGGTLALGLVVGFAGTWLVGAPIVVVALFLAFFFRDPDRQVPVRPDVVVSPADGRVLIAGPAERDAAPPGEWQQVSIFLSPMNVHVNRIPVGGHVTRTTYTPGRFLPAFRPDAARVNERSEIWIDHGGQVVVARQVVGVLARRVVCRTKTGADVRTGDRYGVMKFGSRMDVFLPVTAELLVKTDDVVRGGETVIAVLH
jgi:phosphatidylserine decarboxylase